MLATLILLTTQSWQEPVDKHHSAKKASSQSSIHEVDEQDLEVLAHIDQLEHEINSQINYSGSKTRIQLLKRLYNELEEIAQDYTQLSPGTAFLGPLSTISLVLKQREMQRRIAKIEEQIFI